MTLDEIFAREFKGMSLQRAAMSRGKFGLGNIPLPPVCNVRINTSRKVLLHGISDPYYKKLNNVECTYLVRPSLKRRKYGQDNQPLRNKDGGFVAEAVHVPNDCIAILTSKSLGLPFKYKSTESFEYVDFRERVRPDGSRTREFVYLVPKKYCYELNQLALVMSLTRLRSFYYGQSMVMQNGITVYLYVINFKPSTAERNYRILRIKTQTNFSKEIDILLQFWQRVNLLYPVRLTLLSEPVKGVLNVAYEVFCATQNDYVKCDRERSLAQSVDDFEFE